MKPIWRESYGLLPWLILVAIFLGLAVLIKENKTSLIYKYLSTNKDTIPVITYLINTFIIVTGAIFSYLRFFKGRLFRPKLIIKLNVNVIKIDNTFLHSIEMELQNIGSVSIWNYQKRIIAIFHSECPHSVEVTDFLSLPDIKKSEELIDAGESSFIFAHLKVPINVSAVTYQTIIYDQISTKWTRTITVKNSEKN